MQLNKDNLFDKLDKLKKTNAKDFRVLRTVNHNKIYITFTIDGVSSKDLIYEGSTLDQATNVSKYKNYSKFLKEWLIDNQEY